MGRDVFTYGTLMFPPVWHAVTGLVSFGRAATLSNFARWALRDRTYPGLIEEPGAAVDGILYLDVDEGTLARLDAFEGAEYERVEVEVRTEEGPRVASTYVLSAAARKELEPRSWDPGKFVRNLAPFVASRVLEG